MRKRITLLVTISLVLLLGMVAVISVQAQC